MEIILLELSTYASSVFHAIASFLLWLAVLVGTAAVLVYNRVTKELMEMLHMSEEEREDRHGATIQYRKLQPVKVDRDRAA